MSRWYLFSGLDDGDQTFHSYSLKIIYGCNNAMLPLRHGLRKVWLDWPVCCYL